MKPLGGEADVVFGQCHFGQGHARRSHGCGRN
jgi:hypothetical protein